MATIDTSPYFKVKPVDIAGSMQAGNEARLSGLRTKQAETEINQQQADDAALKEYMSTEGANLYTSEGLDKALGTLSNKLSAPAQLKLTETRDKLRNSELTYKNAVMKADDTVKAHELETQEGILKYLAPVIEEKDPEKRAAAKAQTFEMLGKATRADGKTPLFSPQTLQQMAAMPDPMLNALYSTSEAKKSMLELAGKEAGVEKTKKQTEALAGTGPTEEWVSGGKTYLKGVKTGKTWEVGEDGTTLTPVSALPNDAVKKGTKAATGGVGKAAEQMELMDFEKHPPTTQERLQAEEYATTGKLGQLGAGSSVLRGRIIALGNEIALERGESVAGNTVKFQGLKSNVSNLQKQLGVIRANEGTILGNLELMKKLVDKVDTTGVPVLERWVRGGRRALQGDPDVAQFDGLIVSTKADIARVLSGVTGAAGTPVRALEEANKYFNSDMTKDQFEGLYTLIPKEMDARTRSTEAEISRSIGDINEMVRRRGGSAPKPAADAKGAAPAAEKKGYSPPDPEGQKAIYTSELEKARERYRTAKSEEEKNRAAADRDGIIREMRAAKIEVPEDKAAPAAAEPGKKPKVTISGW